MKSTKGEQTIINLLRKEGVKFEREKEFSDLKKGKYRYDFYLPDERILIEFDGPQHFRRVGFFQKAEGDFRKAQGRDRQKNNYALLHGIQLYRIPYWELDNLKHYTDLFQLKFRVFSVWHNDDLWHEHESYV